MDYALAITTTESDTQIFVSELSAETLRDNGIQPRPGLYLYEVSDAFGIRVLASLPDEDSAYRMLDIFEEKGAR